MSSISISNANVSKWGNSLGVRLPKALTEEMNVEAGDKIHFTVTEHGVFTCRIVKKRAIKTPIPVQSLEELFADFHEETRLEEFDWGQDIGLERLD